MLTRCSEELPSCERQVAGACPHLPWWRGRWSVGSRGGARDPTDPVLLQGDGQRLRVSVALQQEDWIGNDSSYWSCYCKHMWPSGTIWRHRSRTVAQVMACCLTAWSQYQNQCLLIISSVRFSDIHLKAILQQIPRPSITKICLKMTCLKFHLNLPGAYVLTLPSAIAGFCTKMGGKLLYYCACRCRSTQWC